MLYCRLAGEVTHTPFDAMTALQDRTNATVDFRCKLCRATEADDQWRLKTKHGERFDLARCRNCGLIQTVYPWWETKPVRKDNPTDRYHEDWDSSRELAAMERKAQVFASLAAENLSLAGARVLDIGCGKGHLLAALRAQGAQVTGLEVTAADVQFALEKLNLTEIHMLTLDEFEASDKFDLIISLDVLEHVHDLRGFLQDCRALLAPGGVMLHATPGSDSLPQATGRLLARTGLAPQMARVLCNLSLPTEDTGHAHVQMLSKNQIPWIAELLDLDLRAYYVSSFTYSDKHYASYMPLPEWLGVRLFPLIRRLVRNKLILVGKLEPIPPEP